MDRAGVDSSPAADAAELSPCRSPSTPRHLRYRQPGGEHSGRDSEICKLEMILAPESFVYLTISVPKYFSVSVMKINWKQMLPWEQVVEHK